MFFKVRAPLRNHCVLQHSSSHGGCAVRLYKFGPPFKTIVFYNIPAPKEALQFVFPDFGPPSKPLCSTAYQLLDTLCSSSFQVRAPRQNRYVLQHPSYHGESADRLSKFGPPLKTIYVLQHSNSQGGSAVRLSKFGPPFETFVFYSIPAPWVELQLVFQSSGSPSKLLCFTSFQLPRRVCSSSFQVRAPLQNHCILQHSGFQRGPAVRLSKFGPPFETIVFNSIPAQKRKSATRLSKFGPTFKTIIFYRIPIPENDMQFVFPSSGSLRKPLCSTAFQAQRGSAIRLSKFGLPFKAVLKFSVHGLWLAFSAQGLMLRV